MTVMITEILFADFIAKGIVEASAQDASVPWDGVHPAFTFFWFTFHANVSTICSNLKSSGVIGEFHLSTRNIELPYTDPASKTVILHIKVWGKWYNSGILLIRAPA